MESLEKHEDMVEKCKRETGIDLVYRESEE